MIAHTGCDKPPPVKVGIGTGQAASNKVDRLLCYQAALARLPENIGNQLEMPVLHERAI